MRRGLLTLWAGGCSLLASVAVMAQPAPAALTDAALLQADTLTYDRDRDTVEAAGNVELTYGPRTLRADTLSYDQRADRVTATGNVSLLEATGEVLFADRVELTSDMKEGFVRGFRMLLDDDSRLAAAGGRRLGGTISELDRAVFSPCKLCAEDPTRAPLWQIKAARVIHNSETHDFVYRDAWIEVFGVPVFYTPFLSHPDQTVSRRSGFLSPSLAHSDDLGWMVRMPYHWAIAPDRDFTFDPMLTSLAGTLLSGDYRQRFANGDMRLQLTGAFTTDDGGNHESVRGHVDGALRLNLDETWRTGGALRLATDDNYLERYDLGNEDTLTSRAYLEGFWRRSYALAETYHFQGLNAEDDQGLIPIVLPRLNFNYLSEPLWHNGRASFDANLQMLTRTDGTDTGRLSLHTGWRQPFAGILGGDRVTLAASLALDAFSVRDGAVPPQQTADDGVFLRVFPQVALEWSFPFVRRAGTSSLILEPMATLVAAPTDVNSRRLPNEESFNVELDDTNLWSLNRYAGDDRVEGGVHADYGLRLAWYGAGGANASAFLGQTYRLTRETDFGAGTGLDRQASDLVGRLSVSPHQYFDAYYRFRVDEEGFAFKRHELTLNAGPQAVRVGLNYTFVGGVGEFDERQEIAARFDSRITDAWRFTANARRDLSGGGGMVSWGGGIAYADECIDVFFGFNRRFTADREVPPSDTFMLRVGLKYLGEIGNTGG